MWNLGGIVENKVNKTSNQIWFYVSTPKRVTFYAQTRWAFSTSLLVPDLCSSQSCGNAKISRSQTWCPVYGHHARGNADEPDASSASRCAELTDDCDKESSIDSIFRTPRMIPMTLNHHVGACRAAIAYILGGNNLLCFEALYSHQVSPLFYFPLTSAPVMSVAKKLFNESLPHSWWTTDLTRKTVIVTRANTGVGYETAKAINSAYTRRRSFWISRQALLLHNAKVYIAARSVEKSEAAIKSLQEATDKGAIFLKLDLASSNAVKVAAEEFNR